MKKIFSILATVLVLSSCVKDLNTLPLNPTDTTSETAYTAEEGSYLSGLARIYFQFLSCDLKDLQLSDAGASELIRAFWSLNEVSADAAKCAWNGDAWVAAINTNTWSDADNDAAYAVYVRTMQGVAYANEFLRQTAEDRLDDRGCSEVVKKSVAGMRAEARFLRAYLYWMAMDTFGSVPFTTEDSPFGAVNPVPKSRPEVFNFLVEELTDLVNGSDMPTAQSNYPRADKGSCLGLLARLYVNAKVYTGTAMWTEARATCDKIFALGYGLAPEYSDIFRGDNGQNPDVRKELLWAVDYNAEQTQSWGGTSFITFAAAAADDVTDTSHPTGVFTGWGGIRVPFEYVQTYFNVSNPDYTAGTYDVTDKRGKMFYIAGRTETIDNLAVFVQGWSCFKFNNIPHDMTDEEFNETAKTKSYSDIDYPMIRLAEIYLIYAEACMHLDDAASAMPYVRALSERAGVFPPSSITEEWLVAERARELMWEGHRRTDLIRYGLFNSDSYTWPWKGGAMRGQGFDSHLNIFAIPASELSANPELKQNPGYGKQS